MRLVPKVLLAGALVRGTTCTGNLTDPVLRTDEPMRVEVRFVNVGNGCWVLSNRFGHRYEPMQLAEEFRHEGMQVVVKFRQRADVGSVCNLRDVIEIEEIAVAPPTS